MFGWLGRLTHRKKNYAPGMETAKAEKDTSELIEKWHGRRGVDTALRCMKIGVEKAITTLNNNGYNITLTGVLDEGEGTGSRTVSVDWKDAPESETITISDMDMAAYIQTKGNESIDKVIQRMEAIEASVDAGNLLTSEQARCLLIDWFATGNSMNIISGPEKEKSHFWLSTEGKMLVDMEGSEETRAKIKKKADDMIRGIGN